jgi:hypothetical protein
MPEALVAFHGDEKIKEKYVNRLKSHIEADGGLMKTVKKGAAWLDVVKKNWWKDVKLEGIDLELFEGCVIGQVFNPEVSRELTNVGPFGITHGFRIRNGKRSDYLKLSSVWAKEIEKRNEDNMKP